VIVLEAVTMTGSFWLPVQSVSTPSLGHCSFAGPALREFCGTSVDPPAITSRYYARKALLSSLARRTSTGFRGRRPRSTLPPNQAFSIGQLAETNAWRITLRQYESAIDCAAPAVSRDPQKS